MLKEVFDRVNKIDGWFTKNQCEILEPYVMKLGIDELLVELGTYRGKSTLFFTLTNPFINIITIDMVNFPWTTKTDPNGMVLVSKPIDESILRAGKIMQVIGKTSDVVKTFNLRIAMLFIDCNHDYQWVKEDIVNWSPFVKVGGIMAFHDYDKPHEGVMRAVNEFVNTSEEFELIDAQDSIAVLKRELN
jgi:predicted O-methyltransferase YrrM